MYRALCLSLLSILCVTPALAAQKPITGTFSKAPSSGTKVLAVSDSGRSSTGTISKKSFSVVPPDATARLYLLKNGKITGQVVLSKCQGSDKSPKKCKQSEVHTSFKAGKSLGKLEKLGLAYVAKRVSLASVNARAKSVAASYVPVGLKTKGLPTNLGARAFHAMSRIAATATTVDVDKDGLVEALDVDDNGNGIIDNYDNSGVTQPANSFRVFSNFKLEMSESLNLHATGLSTALVDSALSRAQTLAIAVAGAAGEVTELDCTGLAYCSAGGTGTAPPNAGTAFPGGAGGAFDPDSDGFGTITNGATGDFQLATGASTSTISAGDTLIERVLGADGAERQIPGVLNFIFTSTPAIKSVAINSDPAQTIDYTVTNNRLGSLNNCILVPETGAVVLKVTGWRPQRAGVSGAGEAAYVDLGNSKITIDIPNGPTPGGPARGPGNCVASAYSESDTNLSVSADGLQDSKGDIDADASNTYEFTLDVNSCLASSPSGAISWDPGQSLSLDLQFRSRDGDNAAQKICLRRVVPG